MLAGGAPATKLTALADVVSCLLQLESSRLFWSCLERKLGRREDVHRQVPHRKLETFWDKH